MRCCFHCIFSPSLSPFHVSLIARYDGKKILANWLEKAGGGQQTSNFLQVNAHTDLSKAATAAENQWIHSTKLVVKPDQLIKRRGKSGLIALNVTWPEAVAWIEERRGKEVAVGHVSGILDHFLVEPFLPHKQSDEYYICIQTQRTGDQILFYHEGGVDVGDVDAKASTFLAPLDGELKAEEITKSLLEKVPSERQPVVANFILALLKIFQDLHFSYLEINPLVVLDNGHVAILDLAAKIDETASFECAKKWGPIDFPPPFGRQATPEELFVKELDGKTGASLKLTILNPNGRVWLMVAGGGASVIYADTVTDAGYGHELANYGEYSGAPTTAQTYDYARTILSLMTRTPHAQGKVLLIGGGIANFTDIAQTFKGVIKALTEYKTLLIQQKVKILVRRAGPNWQEGLELMRNTGTKLGIDIQVYGPELHMTSIVPMALGLPVHNVKPRNVPEIITSNRPTLVGTANPSPVSSNSASSSSSTSTSTSTTSATTAAASVPAPAPAAAAVVEEKSSGPRSYDLFTPDTQAIVYGLQTGAVQNMLDFDFICGREQPSVVALVYPFMPNHFQKFYWQSKEILIPCIQDLKEAITRFPKVSVVVNFASFRSVYETTSEVMNFPQIRCIAIIAEGVPERRSRQLIARAAKQGVTLIGPATVGGIKPGCFRIGNTGGMRDNIIASRLYRPGSVAYVTRSGGMSNELNNILAQNSNGVYEGVAIGGDRFPGTTFIDHLLRYEKNPDVKMLVVLGEVGGVEEYEICRLIKEKVITKPLIAWCIGTCAKMFPYDVQFGHAGACANAQKETADDKNRALKLAGAIVPESFEKIGTTINETYCDLLEKGLLTLTPEMAPPVIPVDYSWANKLGLIRKPASFISSISDERGDELKYAGVKISEVISSEMGVGGVVGLLWFRRKLPDYFSRFIELVLQLTADHGPAVAGAHNTIVCARAGKDLISSLCSGLLTVGPRFGGALDDAARKFAWGFDSGMSPDDFVEAMRKSKELIPGIGHKIKSLEDPDARVAQLKEFVSEHIKSPEVFTFACNVEKITTKKKSNLILNVDGAIAVAFVDMLRSCGAFTVEEANEYIEMGILNGLFVLGRSIGFIGHWIDQNRLKQPLYRHPTEDISYITDQPF